MRHPRPLILLMLALIACARPGLGQNADLKPLLAGTANIPLTLKLGDLNGDWRRMSVGLPADSANAMESYAALLSGGAVSVYYTRGDTVTVGSDQYLVAYHVPTPKFDFQALQRAGTQPPKPVKLTAATTLTLALLNLHTISSLSDIRPFDLTQEMTESDNGDGLLNALVNQVGTARQKAVAVSSDSNLKQLGLGIIQYVQDYDEVLPPMTSAATAKKAIFPYEKNDAVFIDPITQQPYLPNTSLSHRTLSSVKYPAEMVLYYEASPAPDNTRALLFLDGHVKRVPEAEWPRLKAASHVPNTPVPTALPPGGQ